MIKRSEIKICGEMSESKFREIYATFENPKKGYDSQELVNLVNFNNSNNSISVDLLNITSLCIHVNIKSQYEREFSVIMK